MDQFEINLRDDIGSNFANELCFFLERYQKLLVRFDDFLLVLGLDDGLFESRESRLQQRASNRRLIN